MKKVFDPDLTYPDCMIPDEELSPVDRSKKKTTTKPVAYRMDPEIYKGYLAAKERRINPKQSNPKYWEGVLIFASRKAKDNLRPIEEHPQTRYNPVLLEFFRRRPDRTLGRRLSPDPDRNILHVPDGWIPPTHMSPLLHRLMLSS